VSLNIDILRPVVVDFIFRCVVQISRTKLVKSRFRQMVW